MVGKVKVLNFLLKIEKIWVVIFLFAFGAGFLVGKSGKAPRKISDSRNIVRNAIKDLNETISLYDTVRPDYDKWDNESDRLRKLETNYPVPVRIWADSSDAGRAISELRRAARNAGYRYLPGR